MSRSAAAWLGVLVAAACSQEKPAGHEARPATMSSARTAAARASASEAAAPEDAAARALLSARISTLKPTSWTASTGMFEATLEGSRPARLTLALRASPTALRRPLAFARLAAELGFHVVPMAVARPMSVGEVGSLLADQPASLEFVRAEARVLNDGTIFALLTASAPSVGAREVDPRSSFEARGWERAAASADPAAGERATLVRDFVEMLVLDYLTACAARRVVLLDADAGSLVLDDNRAAFPSRVDAGALEPLLRRLRAVVRFPRGLLGALTRLTRARAAALLAPEGFETWLLSPRALIELDERRAGLLSLLVAQIAQRGEAAVLSL